MDSSSQESGNPKFRRLLIGFEMSLKTVQVLDFLSFFGIVPGKSVDSLGYFGFLRNFEIENLYVSYLLCFFMENAKNRK